MTRRAGSPLSRCVRHERRGGRGAAHHAALIEPCRPKAAGSPLRRRRACAMYRSHEIAKENSRFAGMPPCLHCCSLNVFALSRGVCRLAQRGGLAAQYDEERSRVCLSHGLQGFATLRLATSTRRGPSWECSPAACCNGVSPTTAEQHRRRGQSPTHPGVPVLDRQQACRHPAGVSRPWCAAIFTPINDGSEAEVRMRSGVLRVTMHWPCKRPEANRAPACPQTRRLLAVGF